MTEKRFEFREVNNCGITPKLWDNEKQEYANLLECVDWLNTLHEENKLLELEDERWVKASEHDQEVIDRLRKENGQLKSVIGRLKRTIEEYEEQKENDSTISRNDFNNSEKDDEKNCGLCKHYNLDGMFGVWCDIHEIPTHDKYCSDFERNRR